MKNLPYYIPIVGIFFAAIDFEPLSESSFHFFGTGFVQGISIGIGYTLLVLG